MLSIGGGRQCAMCNVQVPGGDGDARLRLLTAKLSWGRLALLAARRRASTRREAVPVPVPVPVLHLFLPIAWRSSYPMCYISASITAAALYS